MMIVLHGMTRNLTYVALITGSLLTGGCTRYAYYQSPFHVNSAAYKTMPLQADNSSAAWYASGAISAGSANNGDDNVGLYLSAYRAHRLPNLAFYYGLNAACGTYQIESFGPYQTDQRVDTALLNTLTGVKFYGGVAVTAGAAFVWPFRHGEWRVLGIESSLQKEFGSYSRFRKALPDTAVNGVDKRTLTYTVGLSSDIIGSGSRSTLGLKWGFYYRFPTFYGNPAYASETANPGNISSAWFSQTLHLTVRHITGYVQVNTGFRATSFQAGVNYRIH